MTAPLGKAQVAAERLARAVETIEQRGLQGLPAVRVLGEAYLEFCGTAQPQPLLQTFAFGPPGRAAIDLSPLLQAREYCVQHLAENETHAQSIRQLFDWLQNALEVEKQAGRLRDISASSGLDEFQPYVHHGASLAEIIELGDIKTFHAEHPREIQTADAGKALWKAVCDGSYQGVTTVKQILKKQFAERKAKDPAFVEPLLTGIDYMLVERNLLTAAVVYPVVAAVKARRLENPAEFQYVLKADRIAQAAALDPGLFSIDKNGRPHWENLVANLDRSPRASIPLLSMVERLPRSSTVGEADRII